MLFPGLQHCDGAKDFKFHTRVGLLALKRDDVKPLVLLSRSTKRIFQCPVLHPFGEFLEVEKIWDACVDFLYHSSLGEFDGFWLPGFESVDDGVCEYLEGVHGFYVGV